MKRKIMILVIVSIQSLLMLSWKQEEPQSKLQIQNMAEILNININDILEKDDNPKVINNEIPSIEEEIQENVVDMVEEKIEIPISVPTQLQITSRLSDDPYPESGESIATITIPALNLYQIITYGDEQANIDAYDICLRTYQRFDQNGAVLLAGHNYKSFSSLKYLGIGDEIQIHSYYGDFTFVVDNVSIGTTDGTNIYDSENNPLIDFDSRMNRLYLYTCDDTQEQSRVLISAHRGG